MKRKEKPLRVEWWVEMEGHGEKGKWERVGRYEKEIDATDFSDRLNCGLGDDACQHRAVRVEIYAVRGKK